LKDSAVSSDIKKQRNIFSRNLIFIVIIDSMKDTPATRRSEAMIDHISVCICTFRRPGLLARLLDKLRDQVTERRFDFSILVVDNDYCQSAKPVVDSFMQNSEIGISYYNEPEQSISLARNMGIRNAKGGFIAFIDDDEIPDDQWLFHLYQACREYAAAGVLGPVIPHYEVEPPSWVTEGKLCERKTFATGTSLLYSRDTRTGNVLFDRTIFRVDEEPFDPQYGRSGGEDSDFFRRMIKRGYLFIWCNEGLVYENVPAERLKKSYFLKRALLRGTLNARNSPLFSLDTAKSFFAFLAYTAALPVLFLIGQHAFMKYLIKNCDHIGKLLGRFGIKVMRERTF
jgi:succinoglycan biosynthesis protein ExoM